MLFHASQRLAYSQGGHVTILCNSAVQLFQKRPATEFVILPGILSIQDDRDQRVTTLLQYGPAILPNAIEKMFGGIGGSHACINEANQVTEIVVAEDTVHLVIALLP